MAFVLSAHHLVDLPDAHFIDFIHNFKSDWFSVANIIVIREKYRVRAKDLRYINRNISLKSETKYILTFALVRKKTGKSLALSPKYAIFAAKNTIMRLRIREACRDKGTTQAALAQKLGVRATSLSQVIARDNCDVNYLQRIADILGVQIKDLFRDDVPQKNIVCPHCGKPLNIKVTK